VADRRPFAVAYSCGAVAEFHRASRLSGQRIAIALLCATAMTPAPSVAPPRNGTCRCAPRRAPARWMSENASPKQPGPCWDGLRDNSFSLRVTRTTGAEALSTLPSKSICVCGCLVGLLTRAVLAGTAFPGSLPVACCVPSLCAYSGVGRAGVSPASQQHQALPL
jgi:hypothetical protein